MIDSLPVADNSSLFNERSMMPKLESKAEAREAALLETTRAYEASEMEQILSQLSG